MNGAGRVRRLWHTLRHLKPIQFYGRARFYFAIPRARSLSSVPTRNPMGGAWQMPAINHASMLAPDRFRILNQEHALDSDRRWHPAASDKLWRYNLHYFDDLNAEGAQDRREWHQALTERWIAENPPGAGDGWEPYPTSLRIVNWVKWALGGKSLSDAALSSLGTQACWLQERLEWHLLGNHLFANAKALVFAGAFFANEEAARWRKRGLRLIADQLPQQILPDGGNFERSPMYHAIFLEDLLDLCNLAMAFPGLVPAPTLGTWKQTALRMLMWLDAMTHPDGEIAFFNDAAFGVAKSSAQLWSYATRLGIQRPQSSDAPLTILPDSGYVRLENDEAVALLDVAPIGPDYLPGHAHADTLSFELSVHGQRLVVNGGTSCYGRGPERHRERQTASHSTVEIDGADSSEVWAGFRVARRAYPFGLTTSQEGGVLSVACSHDGYRRLSGRPVHRRNWVLSKNSLTIEDTITGAYGTAVARFLIHPGNRMVANGSGWAITLPKGRTVQVSATTGSVQVFPASYAPEFGKVVPASCLTVEVSKGRALTRLEWD